MKHTSILTHLPKVLRLAAFGAMCTLSAFVLGIQTAGDVHPFSRSEAAIEQSSGQANAKKGDINGNGVLDIEDAIAILEFAESLETPSPAVLAQGDLDGDFRLTTKDALRILRML